MSLCTDCNCAICCDGTLYSYVPLKDKDFPRANDVFTVIWREVGENPALREPAFGQPCKQCHANSCSIYVQRPTTCSDYRCNLLVKHTEGKISTKEAEHLINNIKAIAVRVRPQLEAFVNAEGILSLSELIALLSTKLHGLSAAERQFVPATMLLDVGTLRILLAKHFDSRLTRQTREAEKQLLAMEGRPAGQSGANTAIESSTRA